MKTFLIGVICALALLVSTQTTAQYNRTFEATGPGATPTSSQPFDLVAAGNGEVCVGSIDSLNRLLLRKLDFSGNIIFEQAHSFNGISPDWLSPTDLIQTYNGEYLVAGNYYESPSIYVNPFVARFDAAGNLIWIKKYHVNNNRWILYGYGDKRVLIAAVEDDMPDAYIISTAGQQTVPTTYDQDAVIHMFRIDGNGSVIWNKKYSLPATVRNTTYYYYASMADNVDAICYGNDGTGGKYLISGTRFYARGFYLGYEGFVMSVDKNGNIVDNYQAMVVPTYPFDYAAIYDAKRRQFVLAYTMGDNNLVGPPEASQITISKFDFHLNHLRTDYYWMPESNESYAFSIMKNDPDDSYVLPCWVSRGFEGTSDPFSNVAMLKVDQLSGNPIFFERYNIERGTYPVDAIVSNVDPVSSTENYVMLASTNLVSHTRVISASTFGYTCGAYEQEIRRGVHTPTLSPLYYEATSIQVAPSTIELLPDYISSNVTDCDMAFDPNTYRHYNSAGAITLKETAINVYPSIIDNSTGTAVHMDVASYAKGAIDIYLYDLSGKEIRHQKSQISEGVNSLLLSVTDCPPGMYLLKLNSPGLAIYESHRITRR